MVLCVIMGLDKVSTQDTGIIPAMPGVLAGQLPCRGWNFHERLL